MPKKRVFISFAIEDRGLRDLFAGQRLHTDTPFEYEDHSVKTAWDTSWKTNCRSKIKGCDGVIALITKNTPKADGQLWEIKCAYEEGKPVLLLYGRSGETPANVPEEIKGRSISAWTWDRVEKFISAI